MTKRICFPLYHTAVSYTHLLVASGTIINGTIKDSVIFKKVFVGGNCHIRNCIILNLSLIHI